MRIISNTPKLDPTQNYLVARALECSMREYYADSANRAKFEEWKSKKRGGKQSEITRDAHSKG